MILWGIFLTGNGGRDRLRAGKGRDRLIARDHQRDRVNGGGRRNAARIAMQDSTASSALRSSSEPTYGSTTASARRGKLLRTVIARLLGRKPRRVCHSYKRGTMRLGEQGDKTGRPGETSDGPFCLCSVVEGLTAGHNTLILARCGDSARAACPSTLQVRAGQPRRSAVQRPQLVAGRDGSG